jgi:RCR-type E3 ubiquitin transferase
MAQANAKFLFIIRNCFCGHGNSGCVKCGSCKSCIAKQDNDTSNGKKNLSNTFIHILNFLFFLKDLMPASPEKLKIRAKKEVKINIDELNFPNESERVAPLAPSKIVIPSSSPVIQIACGLHHTVVLTAAGEVFTFGSNQYGQLGTGDLQPVSSPVQVKIPTMASQVTAGSNHTVVLTTKGLVLTFGNYQKGQLGRLPTDGIMNPNFSELPSTNANEPFIHASDFRTSESASSIFTQRQRFLWNCTPAPISGIGSSFRKKACWINASGDQTFIKIDESLVNASSLAKISVAANKNTVMFISNNEGVPGCITINKQDGKCRTHISNQFLFNLNFDGVLDEMSLSSSMTERVSKESGSDLNSSSSSSSSISTVNNTIFTIDPLYDVLWCFDVLNKKVLCFNILASKAMSHVGAIFKSDITLPNKNVVNVTRVHSCLNVLACLDTLAYAQNSLDTCFESDTKEKNSKALSTSESSKDSKESRKICRFEAFGGGWGYFGHSVEAVRVMSDTDILMDAIGVYGGRGEYTCKIKIFDLGADGGGFEKDGVVIYELDDIPYFCPARTIHNVMFPKPVNIVAGKWYLIWVKVSGPSSDCGSSGQNIVVGDDQVVFTFKSSKKSNNGTDINSGQIPSILYRVVAHDRKISEGANKSETVCKISKQFINTISSECFENLVKLLSWSWSQFKVKINEMVEKISSSDEMLLNRYVYTCEVCLRLLKKYINEIYPSDSFKFNESEKPGSRVHHQNEISKSSQLPASSASIASEVGSQNTSRKSNVEKIQLAENIGNVRSLLIQIMCDDLTTSGTKSKN